MIIRRSPSQVGFVNAREILQDAAGISGPDLPSSIRRASLARGFMTVALGLFAYELAGDRAGAVLGTALAIKMVAYVGIAPLVGGFTGRLPRRAFLVAMDALRASVVSGVPRPPSG